MFLNSLGGIRIIISHHWPQVEDGTRIVRYEVHPFIKWLARWLPIDPWVEAEHTKYRDGDPIIDKARGILYCSPAQAEQMRLQLATN